MKQEYAKNIFLKPLTWTLIKHITTDFFMQTIQNLLSIYLF